MLFCAQTRILSVHVLAVALATALSPAPWQDMAPALWHGCCKRHLPTWHHRPAHTAWGLLQIGFLCHRKGRDTTDMEETTTPKSANTITRTAPNNTPGKLHIPGQSKARRWSTRSWWSQPGSARQHKCRSSSLPIHQHDQKNTPWFSTWSLIAFSVAGSDFWLEQAQTSHTQISFVTTRCSRALQLTGALQHPTGHTAKEPKKQGYVLILHQATRKPLSQAVEDPGSASSVQAGRTEEGWPDGGTRKPPQPPVLSTTSTTSAMI